MKKLLACLMLSLCLVGCGNTDKTDNTDTNNTNKNEVGYVFEAEGVAIEMGAKVDSILAELGDPIEKFEAKSCAFNGYDKTYTYAGFQLLTSLPEGEEETVSGIEFTDDMAATKEGVYIGSTLDEVTTAYGEDYEEKDGQYTYTKGNTALSFLVSDDSVTFISYSIVE